MLDLNDKRWTKMQGGYRVPFDPRPLLKRLEEGKKVEEVWSELTGELFHQGDVGEASYAAVPHVVRIHEARGALDSYTYALVATIELARGKGTNPEVPAWLQPGYNESIERLAKIGLKEVTLVKKVEDVQYILGLVAIWKGARIYGNLLTWYSETELSELVEKGLEAP